MLLRVLVGHSLKDNPRLWERLVNLRDARNSFVHTGVCRIGRDNPPITRDRAFELINAAEEITLAVRDWLPADLQWPVYDRNVTIEMAIPFTVEPGARPVLTAPGVIAAESVPAAAQQVSPTQAGPEREERSAVDRLKEILRIWFR